jgi:acetylornithine deacetylase/succinyl-diaminopimelate desuccinylase-like protein
MKKTILILILLASFRLSSQSISPTPINNQHLTETSKNNSIDSLIQLCTSKINPDSIKATMLQLQNFGTRFSLAPNHKEVALWLQNKFISMGYNTVLDSFELITHCTLNFCHDTNTYMTMQYNVVATKQGDVNPDREYIIGGHYDSYSTNNPLVYAPGADDDASGVAATIEIARGHYRI